MIFFSSLVVEPVGFLVLWDLRVDEVTRVEVVEEVTRCEVVEEMTRVEVVEEVIGVEIHKIVLDI